MTAPTGPDRTGVVARLDALEAAHKGATPGPWIADSTEIYQEWPGIPGLSGDWIGETCRIEGDPLHATAAADAAAIVAEHNAFGDLLAIVRGVLALADELESFTVNRNPAPGSYDAGVVAAFVNVAARIRAAALTPASEEKL